MAKDDLSIDTADLEEMIKLDLPDPDGAVKQEEKPAQELEALPGFMSLTVERAPETAPAAEEPLAVIQPAVELPRIRSAAEMMMAMQEGRVMAQQPAVQAADRPAVKAEPAPALSYGDFLDEKTIGSIITLCEEIRKALSGELEDHGVDARMVNNMMLRTLEKCALTRPILRNTNWDREGNLRADGSIDTDRFFKNLTGGAAAGDMDAALADALCELTLARLKAVKGLGSDKYAAVRAGLLKKFEMISAGYAGGVASFCGTKVLGAAIKRGDEEK